MGAITDNTVTNPTEQLRPVLNEVFRFKIGEVLTARHARMGIKHECELASIAGDALSLSAPIGTPPKLTVTERIVTECHGGVQIHYRVSGLVDGNRGNPVIATMTEFELVPYGEALSILIHRAERVREARKEREDARKARTDR